MTSSQIRAQAREKLARKWGKAAFITFIFALITYVISFALNKFLQNLGSLIWTILSVPLSFGLIISMFRLNDDKDVSCIDFFNDGFSNFGKAWSVALNTLLKLILPAILVIICIFIIVYGVISQNSILILGGSFLYLLAIIYAIIKQYTYKLAIFILYDNPDISGKEAVNKSAELMQGKVGSLFCLDISFIGWGILSIFTFGIGILWLLPYQQVAEINFYRNLIGEETN